MNSPASIKNDMSPADRAAYIIATGAGAGFAPIAPGTFGAIEAVLIFWAMTAIVDEQSTRLVLTIIINVLLLMLGIWASGRTCKACGIDDPSQVVVDEISGQMIALAPLVFAPSLAGVILAFVLFRLFDIFKPYPIDRLERLPGGYGVMMDDALAGVYAAALVWLCAYFQVI